MDPRSAPRAGRAARVRLLPAWVAAHPPPGPFRASFWRSPLRGPWLTSVFGLVLLIGLPIVTVTGLLSYIAYGPQYGQAFPAHTGWLHFPFFAWPTRPVWLYRFTQGTHVALGLALIPVVLAKLWSVLPKLFTWPPMRSVAQLLERLSLLLLVGSILFELVTGVLNIEYDYVFGFDFYVAHYFGAWVFIAAFLTHVTLKLRTMVGALRSRRLRVTLAETVAETRPEPADVHGLVPPDPRPATMSRRGALGLIASGSALITLVTIGETLGDKVRWTAFLSARGRSYGHGPTDFQINRTAASAGIPLSAVGAAWTLTLLGGTEPIILDRPALLALPQHNAHLPIACVEGWSTTQRWTGVRLRDLAAMAGVPRPHTVLVRSIEQSGSYNRVTLAGSQALDADTMLALQVNGVDLSLDHGFPARMIIPGLPGVHQTKWVGSLSFAAA